MGFTYRVFIDCNFVLLIFSLLAVMEVGKHVWEMTGQKAHLLKMLTFCILVNIIWRLCPFCFSVFPCFKFKLFLCFTLGACELHSVTWSKIRDVWHYLAVKITSQCVTSIRMRPILVQNVIIFTCWWFSASCITCPVGLPWSAMCKPPADGSWVLFSGDEDEARLADQPSNLAWNLQCREILRSGEPQREKCNC